MDKIIMQEAISQGHAPVQDWDGWGCLDCGESLPTDFKCDPIRRMLKQSMTELVRDCHLVYLDHEYSLLIRKAIQIKAMQILAGGLKDG